MDVDPKPGTRVTWDDEDDPSNPVGTVLEPPQHELSYLATCATSYRVHIERDCVWVSWGPSDRGGWTPYEELREVPS